MAAAKSTAASSAVYPPMPEARSRARYLTVKALVPAEFPFNKTSTLYLPAGNPPGLPMWNPVTAGPYGAIGLLGDLLIGTYMPPDVDFGHCDVFGRYGGIVFSALLSRRGRYPGYPYMPRT